MGPCVVASLLFGDHHYADKLSGWDGIGSNSMHHALLKLINEGGSVGGGAIVIQGACECRPKGRAEKTGLVNSHLSPVMMTLVIVPYWIWAGEDLAVFHGKTMKARFAREWSQKVLQTFWMRRHDHPFALDS